jgi:hypothetical protein
VNAPITKWLMSAPSGVVLSLIIAMAHKDDE